MQQSRDGDLLLITTTQPADALRRPLALDGNLRDPRLARLALTRRHYQAERPKPTQTRQREIVRDAQAERETFSLAILAHKTDTLRPSLLRRGDSGELPHANLAAHHFVQTENRAQQLRSPRADEAGDAQHFATPQLKRSRARLGYTAEFLNFQNHIARRALGAWIKFLHVSPDHERDDFLVRCPACHTTADSFTITQDGEAIRDGLHFFEKMRDVDDGDVLGLELSDEGEQFFNILRRERTRWLIQH